MCIECLLKGYSSRGQMVIFIRLPDLRRPREVRGGEATTRKSREVRGGGATTRFRPTPRLTH